FPRLRRPLRLVAHPVDDSHAYTACAIRDDVGVVELLRALNEAGFTLSNDPDVGALVIHPVRPEPPDAA
ncbi:MAG TPA: hypothetical protein PKC95_07960, partial [Thauera aminoaromatica]|nr:hypothetical protein [Thauera aminoaromatica]